MFVTDTLIQLMQFVRTAITHDVHYKLLKNNHTILTIFKILCIMG